MSSVSMLDEIIMNLFIESTKQTTDSYQKHFFPKSRMIPFACTKDLCRILHGKEKNLTKKTLRLHHYIEGEKLRKYLSSILSIDIDESDLGKKKIVHK